LRAALAALALAAAGCAGSPSPAIPPARAPEPAAPAPPPLADRVVLRGVSFTFDSAEIDAASAVVLDVAADPIRERGLRVTVEGHTDSVGEESYNERLSQRRAEAVRSYLVRKGVAPERLVARGLGESSPIASNDTAEGRARNRRVELEVAR
jgi:OOP family OmpA-OmpF porin